MYLLMYLALKEGMNILVLRRLEYQSEGTVIFLRDPSLRRPTFYTHRVVIAGQSLAVIHLESLKDDSA